MRKAVVLTPRGKRLTYRVNCFKDAALLLSVEAVTEKKAEECRRLWDGGSNRQAILGCAHTVIL